MTTIRCLLLGVFSLHAAAAAESGTIKGRVPLGGAVVPIAIEKYTGKISGKVEAPPRPVAGVWLEASGLHAPPVAKTAAVEQRGYQFSNGLLLVAQGARVAFPNLDQDYHNVFSVSKAKRFDLGRYAKDETPAELTFDQPGVVRVYCEIHDHMRSAIVVLDTPYFQKTDANGRYRLTDLPAGRWVLKAWLEDDSVRQQPVELRDDAPLRVDFPAP